MQQDIAHTLWAGRLDAVLARLYGEENISAARTRCADVLSGFAQAFSHPAAALFSVPGRTELGGNHTDHQHGRVLAASIGLDIIAAAAPNGEGVIRIHSVGYPPICADLRSLSPIGEERGMPAALVRGVAARLYALGCPVEHAGFDAYAVSAVPGGSGLSSSAAFGVLVALMVDQLSGYCKCTPMDLAQAAQYAENRFFGKPCGLMDQLACASGGVLSMDFADPAQPVLARIPFDFAAKGYGLCILDCGAGHGDLTAEYAAITRELKDVCRLFGAEYLREVPEEDFLGQLPSLRKAVCDRAVLHALHFYGENRRAAQMAQALMAEDMDGFLALVRGSGRSSAMYLQNIVPSGSVADQPLLVTLALAERFLGGQGAVRVHGGGFGGTAQAFVPLGMLHTFQERMETAFGKNACRVVTVRPEGAMRMA